MAPAFHAVLRRNSRHSNRPVTMGTDRRAHPMHRLVGCAAIASVLVGVMRAPASPAGAPPAEIVQLTGRGVPGDRVTVTWGPLSGDIATTHADGTTERVWFNEHRVVHQGISGDVTEGRTSENEELQAERLLLTGESPGATPATRALAREMRRPRFDGNYAVAWHLPDGQEFEIDGTPQHIVTFPRMPRSAWDRTGVSLGPVSATVAGHPVHLLVDTGVSGLVVSRRFAQSLGLPIANGAVYRTVVLNDVMVGGKTVAHVAAAVTTSPRFDVRAGIGLFPQTNLSFDKNGNARTTARDCTKGYPFMPYSGTVLLRGPDPNTARETTLVSTAHPGPAMFRALNPAMRPDGFPETIESTGERCTATRTPIAFGGRTFGTDRRCIPWLPYFGVDPVIPRVNPSLIVGLDSLDARELLVDVRNSTICWS